jgi:hypothetical protein
MSAMKPAITHATDLQSALRAGADGIPFRAELTLGPLIDFWRAKATRDGTIHGAIGRLVEAELKSAPELAEPITDLGAIDRHRELVDVLMSTVFPPVSWDQEYGAAFVPYQLRAFYATPSCQRLLLDAEGRLQGRVDADAAMVGEIRALFALALVLERVHGIHLDVDYPIVVAVADPDTGLDRYFRMLLDPRFIEVVPVEPVTPLDPAARARVKELLADPRSLADLLRLDRFLFRGFTIFKAIEVTDQEVISSIKRDLIDRESLVSCSRFQGLQQKLRTLFRRPGLHLSLAAIEGDQVLMLNSAARLEHACIFADSAHHQIAEFAGSIYDRAARAGRPLIVEDLRSAERTHVEDELLRVGFRNLVVAPLHYQDELIGMLDLASTEPGELNATHLRKLEDVLPLFSMAVRRSKEELEGRIQAFIKEKCTAIHPSVEWRFRQAVLRGLERSRIGAGPLTEIEPIVFPDVYPLYGLSDIRGSSTQRAFAIQTDLLAQLELARAVLQTAHHLRPLPALDELTYRVDKHAAAIEVSLRSGDEVGLIAFLRTEVEPLFEHVAAFGRDVRARVEAYRAALEPGLGTVYQRRRAFEESVTQISEAISSYLEMEEQAAQAIFPHYFEKQKTDGVDYNIYVGGSLVEGVRFDPIYLRSLRLWQLMVTCGAALRAERLKDRLPIPLETTHLVLAHHAPLSIRFRFDEKRFDVDGAYNMRYQIVKKRVDKAVIRTTGERLTQPGRIAIVYSQPAEAAEYRDYVEYLQHRRYVGREIEDVELEELQGVQGLRALRVAVELDNPELEAPAPLAPALAASRP